MLSIEQERAVKAQACQQFFSQGLKIFNSRKLAFRYANSQYQKWSQRQNKTEWVSLYK